MKIMEITLEKTSPKLGVYEKLVMYTNVTSFATDTENDCFRIQYKQLNDCYPDEDVWSDISTKEKMSEYNSVGIVEIEEFERVEKAKTILKKMGIRFVELQKKYTE